MKSKYLHDMSIPNYGQLCFSDEICIEEIGLPGIALTVSVEVPLIMWWAIHLPCLTFFYYGNSRLHSFGFGAVQNCFCFRFWVSNLGLDVLFGNNWTVHA